MEFEEEIGITPPSYDPNPSRIKMPTHHQARGRGRYMECLKNHALTIGGYALDGCCEFMAAGAHGTIDALKCAACNCHRNFHRKEILPVTPDPPFPHHQPFPQLAYLHVSGQQQRGGGGGGGVPLALPSISGAGGGGGGTKSTRDEQEDVSEPSGGGGSSSSKKRHRTKFTQEQKEKMLGFAERVGWRVQKHDEGAMQEFCDQVGVNRHVLKVWMHNNKNTLGKKP